MTPGEVLKEEFLADYGLGQNELARRNLSPEEAALIKSRSAA